MIEFQAKHNPLDGLLPAAKWLAENAESVFPTPKTWEFFRKSHRDELVREGALFLSSGSRPDYVDVHTIGTVVREILRRESLARLVSSESAVSL